MVIKESKKILSIFTKFYLNEYVLLLKQNSEKNQSLFKTTEEFPSLALLSADCWFSHSVIL